MSTITDKIRNRIKGKGRGWVFGPADFLDIGTRAAVDQVLSRLVKQQKIRRVARGVYDFPRYDDLLQRTLSPTSDGIARVLAGDDVLFDSGATAANLLGFSTQVPARPIYLSNRTNRTLSVGKRTIKIRPAKVKLLLSASHKINMFIQALSYLGKHNIDAPIIDRSVKILSDDDINMIKKHMHALPGWLSDVVHRIDDIKHGNISRTA